MQLNETNFEKIVSAALKQDPSALREAIGSNCIDEWKLGTYFFSAASTVSNKDELEDLISKQVQVLKGNNPCRPLECDKKHKSNTENSTVDKFHSIVGFWEEMHTGKAVVFEENEPQSLYVPIQ